jgi:UDP-N-acetylglucosamine 2-epimerase (non-hydrolysing)
MQPILVIIGTRPDAIKLLPVYNALKMASMPVLLCSTFQHDELLRQVLDVFDVSPDISLHVMKERQDLWYLTAEIIQRTKSIFQQYKPSLVIVQGDTTTATASALSSFYAQIPVAHVEAGLRTHAQDDPFPEEFNRRAISLIAKYHFAPTPSAASALLIEGVTRNSIYCVGNTVIDALNWWKIQRDRWPRHPLLNIIQDWKEAQKKVVLLTMHRRESWHGPMKNALMTIKNLLDLYPDVLLVFPAHPNPVVREVIQQVQLDKHERCHIVEPLTYPDFLSFIMNCSWIITDSGGIQEEAASLGKFSIVLRNKTERVESLWHNFATLTGCVPAHIARAFHDAYAGLHDVSPENLYGDGLASQKIVSILRHDTALSYTDKNSFPLDVIQRNV